MVESTGLAKQLEKLPLVTVIIPTFRDWDRLALCLSSLENQTCNLEDFEVIVVNNDPLDVPPTLSPKIQYTLLSESKPGSYAARNKAIEYAKGKILGFTDSDCLPDINWLKNAIALIGSSQEPLRVTGPVKIFRPKNGSWLTYVFEAITAFNQQHNVRNGVSVTANLFVTRPSFEKVGLFDSTLFSGGDIAWNRLASQQGVALVYSESVVVNHPARATMGEIVRKSRRVLGGGYIQAQRENRVFIYALRHLVPPVKYAKVLIDDGKPIPSVLFACIVYWVIKLLMVLEIIRLSLGGTPARQ